jgi:hypothetical protein
MIQGSNDLDDGVGLAIAEEIPGPAWFNAGHNVDGTTDFYVNNPDDTVEVLRILDGVMIGPLASCAWQSFHDHTVDTLGRPIITSGTYEKVWRAVLPITSGKIDSAIFVDLGAGVTSAAVRIRASRFGGSEITVNEQTGITGDGFATGSPWTIPDTLVDPPASPIGSLAIIDIEGRVTGGAGNLAVAAVRPVVNWV